MAGKVGRIVVWVVLGLTLAGLWVLSCLGPEEKPVVPDPPTVERDDEPDDGLVPLVVGDQKIRVELAVTSEERELGLMYRESLDPDRGMLFVFPEDRRLNFWMKNTHIPLAIAFIRSDGRINEIQWMEPFTTESHISREPGRYALEVNQGWFRERGVKVGDRVKGVPPPTGARKGGE